MLAAAVPASAQATRGLTLGFSGDSLLTSASAATRATWIPRAVGLGAGIVRVNLVWSQVAPAHPPAGFNASDPSSPGYDWTTTDGVISDLAHAGLKVLVNVTFAPRWAEGPNMPANVQPGTWEPNASQFAAFASAAAKRYSGHFANPASPGTNLPAVRYWQAWNEPNLEYYLSPTWTKSGNSWTAVSPGIYRSLLNAFYAAVKGVSKSNFVVSAGTSPYGDQPGVDPPGSQRMPPVQFDRDLFCEKDNTRLSPTSCPNPPHLDAIDHHPYGVGGPTWHALNKDDAAVADVYKIVGVLKAAEREHHVLPKGSKQVWDSEISWDSKPPDPQGVPLNTFEHWVEQSFYVLWSQGVNTVMWLEIADQAPVPNYASTYQAGMYYLNGTPKPSVTAFRFPFVTKRKNRTHVIAWGRAPQAGRVSIEVKRGGRWKLLRRLRIGTHQVFQTTLTLRGKATLRAQIGSQTSLTWNQGK